MTSRLASHVFDLPVQELRRGYLSDVYFWREKIALERALDRSRVTMQVFQKKDAILCGIDEAIAVLRVASGRYRDREKAYELFDRFIELKKEARKHSQRDPVRYLEVMRSQLEVCQALDACWQDGFEELEIEALHDGDAIAPWETVMHVAGEASLFAHLETIYLGVLARRTRVATNVRRVVEAARGKTILYFPARFDHWATQGGDGYAAHVGGAHGVSTDAQGEWWGARAAGTVPHALIAAVRGDTVEAVRLFRDAFPQVELVALVDFDNDCVGTSLRCARALGKDLWGVRLDTAEALVDVSLANEPDTRELHGVVPELAVKVREALDREGFGHVKIIASGGFDVAKIERFERCGAPVDAYGVGSALLRGAFDFTADVVLVEGRPCAKVGRSFRPNSRLERIRSIP